MRFGADGAPIGETLNEANQHLRAYWREYQSAQRWQSVCGLIIVAQFVVILVMLHVMGVM